MIITKDNKFLFKEGTERCAYNYMGAHYDKGETTFSVWAPQAKEVYVVGSFCDWENGIRMECDREYGIWTLTTNKAKLGDIYKFKIVSKNNKVVLKSDPYATKAELRPETGSIIYQSNYKWKDSKFEKHHPPKFNCPINIYEVHFGSWKRNKDGEFLTYKEMAEELIPYVKDMGYTHIELMPVQEHVLDMSWGYQTTNYYAPTSRFGEPDDFKYFVDKCHQSGISIILDWVPSHFCKDESFLIDFDGSALYEYGDSRIGEHKEWGTRVFNFARAEVKSFLISNACYWLKEYHIDGLRVDAVSSMIYLDFGRKNGEWIPNKDGGNINLEAIKFMQDLSTAVHNEVPNALLIAEESTSFPKITYDVSIGGLGFDYKWNMGWMNDILEYVQKEGIHKKYHHNSLTFPLVYAFGENYILAISHDEVVHGKKSLLDKMSGDYWQKFAQMRAFIGYMMSMPGKKLNFMGYEFGQFMEWRYYEGLEFFMVDKYIPHQGLVRFNRDVNNFYLNNKPLWEVERSWDHFNWISVTDNDRSIISYIRYSKTKRDFVISLTNFTSSNYTEYKLGVPKKGEYIEVLNSDKNEYGGSNVLNEGKLVSQKGQVDGMNNYIIIRVPPLATCYFKLSKKEKKA